ncbi:MAG: PilX N-terminal domain-containing pilus assembly protein [Pseudomonadota bacterium]
MRNFRTHSGENGFIIALALIAILVMSFFLLSGTISTTTAVKVSGNYSRSVKAFNIAEAGLAKARPLIENQAFNTLLANYQTVDLIAPTAFQGGTYEVKLANDPTDPGGSLSDTNHIIKVTSIGQVPQGGKVTIDTYVQLITTGSVNFPPAPPGVGESAGLMCGVRSDINTQGASTIDGDNYGSVADLQALIPCTGSGCDLGQIGANSYDIVAEGPVSWGSGGRVMDNLGASSGCAEWRTLYNQLSSFNSNAPGVVILSGTGYAGGWNSCATPKVYIINTTSPTFTFSGNVGLCGTFVVATNTSIVMNGTVTLVGLVLMMGNDSNLSYSGLGGTSNIYGKIVFNSTAVDSQKELAMKGNASLDFSAAGVGFALQAINDANNGGGAGGSGTLLTAAWNESY